MRQLTYLNEQGEFTLRDAQRYGEIYFPLVNGGGMMSSVTPLLAGDCKSGQNTFLLAPASEDSLRSGRDSRNFWVRANGGEPWSATGQSAPQQARRFAPDCEEAVLTGGLLWQRITREHRALGLRASTLSFVPAGEEHIEIMQVTLTNTGDGPLELSPTAAIPLYGRSADNLRDHRHVTSLLHRVELRRHGPDLTPTLTFDERGHQPGRVTYRVWGGDETGAPPPGLPGPGEGLRGGGQLGLARGGGVPPARRLAPRRGQRPGGRDGGGAVLPHGDPGPRRAPPLPDCAGHRRQPRPLPHP